MGVHGLTTYMEKDRRFLVNVRLQATRLVIDGSSLYYSLYFNCGADQQCGGEYEAFAEQVQQFFTALSTCKIQPFVVLDGGMDHSDKKFSTLQERAKRSIKDAHSLSRGSHSSLLPLLTKAVFMQLLLEMAVPLFQCAAEADFEIASLASQWGCPVLTNDSDFYIFPLRGGYIPFRYFQWGGVVVGKQAPSHSFIPARCYTVDRLCSHFQGLTPQMLPLLAVIMGNDYTPPHIKQIFFSRVQLPRTGGRGNPETEGLILWLSRFSSPDEALEEVLELAEGGGKRQKRNPTQSVFSAGMQEYILPPRSSLAQFFSGGLSTLPGSIAVPEILAAQPQWLLQGIFTGRLPSLVQDVLVLRRVMLHAQVENCRLPSSHCTSLPIRQVIYGLLLLGNQQAAAPGVRGRGRGRGMGRVRGRGGSGSGRGEQSGAEGHAQDTPCVVEYDRCDLNLTKSTVNPFLPSGAPQVQTMDQMPLPVRLQMLLRVLLLEERALAPLPPTLRLPMCVTCFWLQRSKPRPDPTILQAVLLGLTFGELCRRRTNPTDPTCSRPGVAAVLHRLYQLGHRRKEGRGLSLEVAHSLSQWQSCMKAALCLNQLLWGPLPDPPCAWLFSGTLLHAVQAALREGVAIETLLAGDPIPGLLYSSLMEATQKSGDCGPTALPGSSCSNTRKRGRGQRKQGDRGRGQMQRGRGQMQRGRGQMQRGRGQRADERDLNNRFAMLMSDEEEDEE